MYNRDEIVREANGYFERNNAEMSKSDCSVGMKIFCDFYDGCRDKVEINEMLEVGCSSGFNLIYMNEKYGIKGQGIEPSDQAIASGMAEIESTGCDVKLWQGFADDLPFDMGAFDLVYMGFCLYQVSRELLTKTIAEADRALRGGGILVITDFDTPLRYVRKNVHNEVIFTYKEDYADCVKPFGYTLVYKKMYSHKSMGFSPNIQDRVSTQIFYKERSGDLYIDS